MDKTTIIGKRALVTGGKGFLGRKLTDALTSAGFEVFVADIAKSDKPNEVLLDICNYYDVESLIKNVKPDIVFHLAANLNRDRNFKNHDEIIKVNYHGTVNLLKALQDTAYENFVFAGTSEVYGNNQAPFSENMCPMPASPYSMSKYFAEVAIKTFSEIYNKNYTILRLFNFYGSNMPDSFFVSQLINSLKSNVPFKMTKGEQKRDFVHIDDVISAIMLVAEDTERAKNEIFNVCSGKSITIKELALQCREIIKSDCTIEFGALNYRENEIWDMTGDNSKIINKLGFKISKNFNDLLTDL